MRRFITIIAALAVAGAAAGLCPSSFARGHPELRVQWAAPGFRYRRGCGQPAQQDPLSEVSKNLSRWEVPRAENRQPSLLVHHCRFSGRSPEMRNLLNKQRRL